MTVSETSIAIFSSGARRLIDQAVAETNDPRKQEIWRRWVVAFPDAAQPGDDWRGAAGTLPFEVVAAVFSALEEMATRKRRELERFQLAEDEVADLDNDLSHIEAVEKFLVHAAQTLAVAS